MFTIRGSLASMSKKRADVVVLPLDLERDRHLGVEAVAHLVLALEGFDLDPRGLAQVADVGEHHLELLVVRELAQNLLELHLELGDLLLELSRCSRRSSAPR